MKVLDSLGFRIPRILNLHVPKKQFLSMGGGRTPGKIKGLLESLDSKAS